MLLLKMGPEVPSKARRALPALRRSEKEDGRRPSEFLVIQNLTNLEDSCAVINILWSPIKWLHGILITAYETSKWERFWIMLQAIIFPTSPNFSVWHSFSASSEPKSSCGPQVLHIEMTVRTRRMSITGHTKWWHPPSWQKSPFPKSRHFPKISLHIIL